jgi:hypothetical protein
MRLVAGLVCVSIFGLAVANEAIACCSLGCCDCSCVTLTAEQAQAHAARIAKALNAALRKQHVSGYASEFRISMVTPPAKGSKNLPLPGACSYVCNPDGNDLVCRAECK